MEDFLSRLRLLPGADLTLAGQLRHRLALMIADGELDPGTPLPSVRALSRRLGVSVNTVRTAYGRLQADGLVVMRQGARTNFLFRGPLSAACTFEPSGAYTTPNLWWPDDRAWVVVTEIEGYSTYVGGGRAAIYDVLASLDVESIEVTLDTHMDPGPWPPRWR